jgi:hypothetical protein
MVVRHGSLTSTEDYKLDTPGNELLRKIFGLDWDDVSGVWKL